MTDRFNALEFDDTPQQPAERPAVNADVFGGETNALSGRMWGTNDDPNSRSTAIGHKAGEHHNNIAATWVKNGCRPVGEFYTELLKEGALKRDIQAPQGAISLSHNLTLNPVPAYGIGGQGVTENGIAMLGALAGFRSGFVTELHERGHKMPEAWAQLAEWLNRGIADADRQYRKDHAGKGGYEWLMRFRHDKLGREVLRATMSQRYGALDNHMALQLVMEGFNGRKLDHVLSSYEHNDGDNAWGTALPPTYFQSFPDSDYGVGIYWKNSEIGSYKYIVGTYLYRAICENGCRWGVRHAAKQVNMKHTKNNIDLPKLREMVRNQIDLGLTEGRNLLQQLGYTREVPVAEELMPKLVVSLAKGEATKLGLGKALTHEQAQGWMNGWKHELETEKVAPMDTAFGALNGLTRAAQLFSGESREAMEALAGDLTTMRLDASGGDTMELWRKRLRAAAEVKPEEVRQVLRIG